MLGFPRLWDWMFSAVGIGSRLFLVSAKMQLGSSRIPIGHLGGACPANSDSHAAHLKAVRDAFGRDMALRDATGALLAKGSAKSVAIRLGPRADRG